MTKHEIPAEVIEELVAPGYSTMETGYYRLPNGDMHVRALIRMPHCKGKMVDWWFGYIQDTQTYKIWHPAHEYFKWDEKWRPGHYIGASHWGKEYLGPVLASVRIKFHDPAEIFDTSKFKAANIGAVIYAQVLKENGEPDGQFLHVLRDTPYGCEMRNRFWLFGAPEVVGAGVMAHSLEEMGNLAEFLPSLYNREKAWKKP